MDATAWATKYGEIIRARFNVQLDVLAPAGPISPRGKSVADWNRQKIETLRAGFRDRFTDYLFVVEGIAAKYDAELLIWDAARPLERQLALYQRGRSDKGQIVTKTIASNHLWGCAVDFALRNATGGPDFSRDLPPWWERECLPLAAESGLSSLLLTANFDPPHIEVPPAEQPPEIRTMARELKRTFPGL